MIILFGYSMFGYDCFDWLKFKYYMRSFAKLKFECYNKNANLLQYNLIQTE